MIKTLFKKYRTLLLVVFVSASTIITYSFVDDYFEISKNLDIFSSAFREVNMYYVDSIEPGKLMKKGIDAMLGTLDPYTNFIPESEIEDYRFMTTGQYGGIGALIRQKGDYVAISEPYEGFPAQKADLRAGDEILEIDGKSAKGKKTDEVSHILKGQPKTEVKLLVKREGIKNPIEKILTREEIKVKSVPYFGMLNNDIGYIRLTGFTENCGADVKEALTKLKEKNNPKGVILDLRFNPGGLLHEAVNVTNVFVDRGQEIVSTRSKMKSLDKSYKAMNTAVDTEIPLAVLVNSGSASASEIVSGSLQDLDRGVIIGQRTFGKGLVQTTRSLGYNAQLKITTSKYYVPSGRCIQALDYSHRNEDGSVGKVPDSLVTEFKTRTGRKVFDGGGILPDVVVEQKKLSNITISLLTKNIIFDFASHYRNDHPTIAPAADFALNENDWNDFVNYIADKEYDYTTKSEKSLDELKKNSEDEKYFDALKNDIDGLKLKLAHNKKEDVDKNREEISGIIVQEIVSRYYFQAGKIEASFHRDPEIQKAIEVLGNSTIVASILNGTFKASGEEPQK
ncbi:MAG: S41 family peptidase [Bacteroidota bacterium]